MATKIMENLWQVAGDGLTDPADAAAYLVRFNDAAALVDAGTGRRHARLVKNIQQCLPPQVPVTHLLLTHCHYDHTGGAEAVRQDFGCRIVAHSLDAVYLESGDSATTAAAWYGETFDPLRIDIRLEDPQTIIEVGSGRIKAIHWPGHSPGSVVYTANINGCKVLFGQDIHGPIHPALRSDADKYQASLKKVLSLQADWLLEGHFGVFKGKKAVEDFIRAYLA